MLHSQTAPLVIVFSFISQQVNKGNNRMGKKPERKVRRVKIKIGRDYGKANRVLVVIIIDDVNVYFSFRQFYV